MFRDSASAANSHLVVVPGDARLFDVVLRSDICRGEDGGVAGAGAAAGGLAQAGGDDADLFGLDEEEDPELQMVGRLFGFWFGSSRS